MDMKHINNQLLIEKYLQGVLSTEEEQDFDELYLSSPELLDQLEAAEQLQQGMKDIAAVAESSQAPTYSRRNASMFHSPRYAMAATVFLTVSLLATGYLYQQNQNLSNEVQAGAGHSAQIVPLYSVRSADSTPINSFSVTAGTSHVVLMVDPGMEPFSEFRASVRSLGPSQQPAPILQFEGLHPGYEDMLALAVPTLKLQAGDYEVVVEGRREAGNGGQFEPINRVTFRIQ